MEKKLFEKIKKQLLSSNKQHVLEALKVIGDEGNSSVIEVLAIALIYHSDEKINNEIRQFFLNIKDNTVVKNILEIIKNDRFLSEKKFFISLCWQLPLRFDDFYDDFLKIFYEEDFENAFEAFTVIDTIINKEGQNFSKEIITLRIDDLKSHLSKMDEQKKLLSMELIHDLMTMESDSD